MINNNNNDTNNKETNNVDDPQQQQQQQQSLSLLTPKRSGGNNTTGGSPPSTSKHAVSSSSSSSPSLLDHTHHHSPPHQLISPKTNRIISHVDEFEETQLAHSLKLSHHHQQPSSSSLASHNNDTSSSSTQQQQPPSHLLSPSHHHHHHHHHAHHHSVFGLHTKEIPKSPKSPKSPHTAYTPRLSSSPSTTTTTTNTNNNNNSPVVVASTSNQQLPNHSLSTLPSSISSHHINNNINSGSSSSSDSSVTTSSSSDTYHTYTHRNEWHTPARKKLKFTIGINEESSIIDHNNSNINNMNNINTHHSLMMAMTDEVINNTPSDTTSITPIISSMSMTSHDDDGAKNVFGSSTTISTPTVSACNAAAAAPTTQVSTTVTTSISDDDDECSLSSEMVDENNTIVTSTTPSTSTNAPPSSSPSISSLSSQIPKFYFPKATLNKSVAAIATEQPSLLSIPQSSHAESRALLRNVRRIFAEFGDELTSESFEEVCQAMQVPDLYSLVFFRNDENKTLSWRQFEPFFNQYLLLNSPMTRLFHMLRNPLFNPSAANRNYLTPLDFEPLLTYLLDMHEGLSFLQATSTFQNMYSQTVILRIFFACTGHLIRCNMTERLDNDSTAASLATSKTQMIMHHREFVNRKIGQVLLSIPDCDNFPNGETHFFSYEQFYVIYVHFWELDSQHTFQIKLNQMGFTDYCMQRIKAELAPNSRTSDSSSPGELIIDYNNFVQLFLSVNDPSDCYGSFEFWWELFTPEKTGFIHLPTLKSFWNSLQRQIRLEYQGADSVSSEDSNEMNSQGTETVAWAIIERQIKDLWNITDLSNIPKNAVRKACVGSSGLGCNVFLMLSSVNGWMDMERTGGGVRKSFAEWAAGEYERLASGDEEESQTEDDNSNSGGFMEDDLLSDDAAMDDDESIGHELEDDDDYDMNAD